MFLCLHIHTHFRSHSLLNNWIYEGKNQIYSSIIFQVLEVIYLERICLRPWCLFLTAFEFWYISSHSILMWLRVLNISNIYMITTSARNDAANPFDLWQYFSFACNHDSYHLGAIHHFLFENKLWWYLFVYVCKMLFIHKFLLYSSDSFAFWNFSRTNVFPFICICVAYVLRISNSLISFYRVFLLFPIWTFYICFWPTTTLLYFGFFSLFVWLICGWIRVWANKIQYQMLIAFPILLQADKNITFVFFCGSRNRDIPSVCERFGCVRIDCEACALLLFVVLYC